MLYGTWECGDTIPAFSNAWVLYSKIAYAVSDYPDRDFRIQKIVLKGRALDGDTTAWDAQMVSNPHLKKFNGKYYLYYIGSVDPRIQPVGSKGEKVDKRNRVQQYQKIGVIEFNSFKDFSGKITEGKPGLALLESLDGIMWTKPDNSFFMKKEVLLNSGDTIRVNRMERPQLLIDENGDPAVLYSACSLIDINPRQDGSSFNVHIPLKIR